MFKDLLNATHDIVHKLLHITLIPVVAILEAAIALLTRLLDEAKRV